MIMWTEHPLARTAGTPAAREIYRQIAALGARRPDRNDKRDRILEALARDLHLVGSADHELVSLLVEALGGPEIDVPDLLAICDRLLTSSLRPNALFAIGSGLSGGLSERAKQPLRVAHTQALSDFLLSGTKLKLEKAAYAVVGLLDALADPEFKPGLLQRLITDLTAPPQTTFTAACMGCAIGRFALQVSKGKPLRPELRGPIVEAVRAYMPQEDGLAGLFAKHFFRELGGPAVKPETAAALMADLLRPGMREKVAWEMGCALSGLLPEEAGSPMRPDLQRLLAQTVRSALERRDAGGATEFLAGMIEAFRVAETPESLRALLAVLLVPGLQRNAACRAGAAVWFGLTGLSRRLSPELHRELVGAMSQYLRSDACVPAIFAAGMIMQVAREEGSGRVCSLLTDLLATGLPPQQAFDLGGFVDANVPPVALADSLDEELVRAVHSRNGELSGMCFAAGVLNSRTNSGKTPESARPLLDAILAMPLKPRHARAMGRAVYSGLCAPGESRQLTRMAQVLVDALHAGAAGEGSMAANVMAGFGDALAADGAALQAVLKPILDARLPAWVRSHLLLGWGWAHRPHALDGFVGLEEFVRAADDLNRHNNANLGKCLGLMLGGVEAPLQALQKLLAIVLAQERNPAKMDGLLRGLPAGLGGEHAPAELLDAIGEARKVLARRQMESLAAQSRAAPAAACAAPAARVLIAVEDADCGEAAAARVAGGLERQRPGQAIKFLKDASTEFIEALDRGQYGLASAFICAICEHSPREEWDPRIAALGAGRVSSLADFMLRLIPEVESAAGRPVASANRWIDRIVLHLHFVGEPSEPVEQAEPMVLRGFASWQAQVDDSKAGAASAPGITEEDLDALIPLEDRNLAKTSVPAFVKWARAAFANPHAVARGMRWSDDGDEQFIPDAKSYPHIHIVDGRAVWSGKADSGRPRIVHGDNIVASSDSMRQFYEETDDLSIRIALHYLNFEAARAWSAELAEA